MPDRPQTVLQLLKTAVDFLSKKELPSPRLDAEVLLAAALGKDRVGLYCCYDRPLDKSEVDIFRQMIKRRLDHEPVAYIIGKKEFYGLDFKVSKDVLTPRPDTETLVEKAIEMLSSSPDRLCCDIGVGSGAICVSILKNMPITKFTAVDISEKALEIARENAETHGVSDRIDFVKSDLFDNVNGKFDLIVSNPPYIAESEKCGLAPEIVDHEPPRALFAGKDGLEVIRKLIDQAPKKLNPRGVLMIECGSDQKDALESLLLNSKEFINLEFISDLGGNFRVAAAVRK